MKGKLCIIEEIKDISPVKKLYTRIPIGIIEHNKAGIRNNVVVDALSRAFMPKYVYIAKTTIAIIKP